MFATKKIYQTPFAQVVMQNLLKNKRQVSTGVFTSLAVMNYLMQQRTKQNECCGIVGYIGN